MKNLIIISAATMLFYATSQVCGCGTCKKTNQKQSQIKSVVLIAKNLVVQKSNTSNYD